MRMVIPDSAMRSFAVGAALALLAGCSPEPSEQVLARVGDTEITAQDFTRHLQERQRHSPVPVDTKVLLQELVDREVMVQNAVKDGLRDDPEIQEMIRDVLISQLKERQLAPLLAAAAVSEEEVKARYELDKQKLTVPERVKLAMLFINVLPDAKEEAKLEARRRLESAIKLMGQTADDLGQGFGPIAAKYSEDQESRYHGGVIGWVEHDRYPPRLSRAVVDAGFALTSPGQVSDVIAGENGFYLVKLLERQSSTTTPLPKVEPTLRSRLLQEKHDQILAEFQSSLRTELPVEVHPELLESLPSTAPSETSPPSIP
jgi:peptidyl-prolyl cis-trans isomerase C